MSWAYVQQNMNVVSGVRLIKAKLGVLAELVGGVLCADHVRFHSCRIYLHTRLPTRKAFFHMKKAGVFVSQVIFSVLYTACNAYTQNKKITPYLCPST